MVSTLIIYNAGRERIGMAGRPPDVSEEDIIEAMSQLLDPFSNPVLDTSEVAAALPIGRKGVSQRLVELAEEGRVNTKMVGNSRAWWLPKYELEGSDD